MAREHQCLSTILIVIILLFNHTIYHELILFRIQHHPVQQYLDTPPESEDPNEEIEDPWIGATMEQVFIQPIKAVYDEWLTVPIEENCQDYDVHSGEWEGCAMRSVQHLLDDAPFKQFMRRVFDDNEDKDFTSGRGTAPEQMDDENQGASWVIKTDRKFSWPKSADENPGIANDIDRQMGITDEEWTKAVLADDIAIESCCRIFGCYWSDPPTCMRPSPHAYDRWFKELSDENPLKIAYLASKEHDAMETRPDEGEEQLGPYNNKAGNWVYDDIDRQMDELFVSDPSETALTAKLKDCLEKQRRGLMMNCLD